MNAKISQEKEIKALIFIVLEHNDFVKKIRLRCVSTDDVTKYLKLEHKDSMKVINALRKKNLVFLRERRSAGLSGNGYDGSLYGALTPSLNGQQRVCGYLKLKQLP